jgi:hypothetical protein
MCSYDALICACPTINDWVRIDQSQADCLQEHQCQQERACPIGHQFLSCQALHEPKAPSRAALIDRLVGRL